MSVLPLGSGFPINPIDIARLVRNSVQGGQATLEVNPPLPDRMPSFILGEELPARVVTVLSESRFIANVKGSLLNLTVRSENGINAQEGSAMKLKVMSLSPRLTFLLTSPISNEQSNQSTSRVTLSGATRYMMELLMQARRSLPKEFQNSMITGDLAGDFNAKLKQFSPEQSSEFIDFGKQALRQIQRLRSFPRHAVKLEGSIFPDAEGVNLKNMSIQISRALSSMTNNTGIFYESHLKQWFLGRKSAVDLLEQPQAKAELPKAVLDLLRSGDSENRTKQIVLELSSNTGKNNVVSNTMSTILGHQVARQLDALEFRQFAFQSYLTPDMPFSLEIQAPKNEERKHEQEVDEEKKNWFTRLLMEMPTIGNVEAKISITDNSVQLILSAERRDSEYLIKDHKSTLYQKFNEAGLSLDQLRITNIE